jgi:hypothetical protein
MDTDEESGIAAYIEVAVLGHPCVYGKAGTHAHPGPDEIENIEDTVGNVEEHPVAKAFPGGLLLPGKCGDWGQEEDQEDDRRQ